MAAEKIKAMESRADSGVVAAPVAMDQLEAMDMVKRIDGAMILQEGWGASRCTGLA